MGTEGAPRKLRLLALHGHNFSASIFEKQSKDWSPEVHDLLDITFLDGPISSAGDTPINPGLDNSPIKEVFEGPYFTWMHCNEDFSVFPNHEEGIVYILDYMEKNGPFDGIMGFSLGAVIGSCIIALQNKKKVIKGKSAADLHPIRFFISMSGAYLRDPNVADVYSGNPMEIPTLHMMSPQDTMFIFNQDFLRFWKDPVVITNCGGHAVPSLDEAAVSTVVSFLNGIQRSNEGEEAPINK